MSSPAFILFDGEERDHLLPLTYTRPVSDIRIGILTIKEKWDRLLQSECKYLTQSYLRIKEEVSFKKENVFINGSILPNKNIVGAIKSLEIEEALTKDGILIAVKLEEDKAKSFDFKKAYQTKEYDLEITTIKHTWDIFALNGQALNDDFELLTTGRKSATISSTNHLIHPERIFFEEGAKVEYANLNASSGPIYIGRNAEIMEGTSIRGGLALCDNATLKLNTKIYGPTTVGPFSKVGGEVNNSVIFGYSNKGHDGFLGNSVIGEWCNLGADTNTSNLKNNYSNVKVWNYVEDKYVDSNLQFVGLTMGDHSKCGINTMFNTGTVVGVSANIFGGDFPAKHIPSFCWGGGAGLTTYEFEKAIDTAKQVYKRRNVAFDHQQESILSHVFEETNRYR